MISDASIRLDDLSLPASREDAVRKEEHFIVLGRNAEAFKFWFKMEQDFSASEKLDFHLYQEVHFRLARLALHRFHYRLAQTILRNVPKTFREVETFQLLESLAAHYQDADRGLAAFPLNVRHCTRYEGPHLLPTETEDGELLRWGAGRILQATEEGITAVMVDPLAPEGPSYGTVTISFEVLGQWSDEVPSDLEEGDFFEVASYGSEETMPRASFWGRTWDGWARLPPLYIDPVRYLRASGLVHRGQSFMEKVLRGDELMSEIDSYVDAWHESESSLTLADYLGMLPEEYLQWVENPTSLAGLLDQRRELRE